VLDMDLTRSGTAAWLGRIHAVLQDVGGRPVQSWERDLAVSTRIHRVLELPLEKPLVSGRYVVSLRLDTERKDLPPEGILPSRAVVRNVALTWEPSGDVPLDPEKGTAGR